jgi:glycosyltransferase involved in cell wall biosynthesis
MKLLIITSENLNSSDTHTSSFELSLASGLSLKGAEVSLLSVYMMTPGNLFKALLIKAAFGFKKNTISERFSLGKLIRFFFSFVFLQKKNFVLQQRVNNLTLYEGIGISRKIITDLPGFTKEWVEAGLAAHKHFSTIQKADLVHGHSRFFLGAALANAIHKEYGLPYVTTEHSSYYFRALVPQEMIPAIRQVYQEAAACTAVSNALRDKVKEVLSLEMPIEVIGNAVPALYALPVDFTVLPAPAIFAVVAVGRLDENKNHTLLLRAFAKSGINHAKLVIAGEGELASPLKELAVSLGVAEAVTFTGRLPKEEIRALMFRSSVLVVSSKVETFSVVVTEAHSCGLPVISTPCGGPAELITSANGILLNDFTEEAMATALRIVFANKDNYNRRQIRENVLSKFGPDAIATQYMGLYEKVIGS